MTTDLEHQPTTAITTAQAFTTEQVDLIKRTVAEGTSDDELALFLQVARRTGLDPFARQIYAVVRNDRKAPGGKKMAIQTGIDGYRLIAQRTGMFRGRVGPLWCGRDGVWKDVWLSDEPPAAAKVGVLRSDCDEPIWAVATWRSYAQTYSDGNAQGLWASMGDVMLAKCAEAQAIRAGFPADTSGVYTAEEMAQNESGVDQPSTAAPEHAAAMEQLEELLEVALELGLISDLEKARDYAAISLAHAQQSIEKIRERIDAAGDEGPANDQPTDDEVVDAELVDDDPGEITGDVEPEPDQTADVDVQTGEVIEPPTHVEVYDWRAHMHERGLKLLDVVQALRKDWPHNSQWNRPDRTRDVDKLAADQDMAKLIAATIDDLAEGR